MKGYDLYIFFLCLIVFVLLTALFTVLITWITRLLIRLIRGGLEDENIKKEYYKTQCGCGGNCVSEIFDKIFSIVFCALFVIVFLFSLSLSLSEEKKVGDIPVMRVVQSGSMSKKYEKNKYLFENNLDDQIQTFDIIVTEKLPDEFDLQLYDIVVYEVDDILVVHRIVKIEEPNEKHPDCRWFTLQGDNVQYPDKTPVYYSQMIAIYNGNRIPYVGSFISFMQSPAGWLCILLILGGSIAIPIVEGILQRERERRLVALGEIPEMGKFFGEWEKKTAKVLAEKTEQATLTTELLEKEEVFEKTTEEIVEESKEKILEKTAEEVLEKKTEELVEQSLEVVEKNTNEVLEKTMEETVDESSMFRGDAFSISELLKQGYRIKYISVRLMKKLEAFKDSKASLVKLVKTRNGIKMYFAYTPKEEAKGKYIFINTHSSKLGVKPLHLKITLKRERGVSLSRRGTQGGAR